MSGTILIVDDEDEIRAVLTDFLEGKGYTVFQAHDLGQARRQLKTGLHPDLVILDVVLGDGDGLSFLRELRRPNDPGREIAVIMVSAHRTSSRDKASGLEIGADDYIAKPFDLKEIGLRIEKLVRPTRGRRTSADHRPVGSRAPDDVASSLKNILSAESFPHAPKAAQPKPTESKPTESKPPGNEMSGALGRILADDFDAESGADDRPAGSGFTLQDMGRSLIALLLEPRRFFSSTDERQAAAVGWVAMLLAGFLLGIQAGIEAKTVAAGFINSLMYPLAYAAGVGIIALVAQWIMGLRRKPIKFKSAFTALSAGFAPMVVAAALGVVYVAVGDGRAGEFTAGPLLLFPAQTGAKYLGVILRRLDVFELWSLWLATSALKQFLGGRRRVIASWVVAVWLLSVALRLVATIAFS